MRSLSSGAMLFSAFVLASPTLMFGRGESARTFSYNQNIVQKCAGPNRDAGARAGGRIYQVSAVRDTGRYGHVRCPNWGDAAFRK